MIDGEALGKTLTAIVRDFVARTISLLSIRIDSLESSMKDGLLKTEEAMRELVLKEVSKIPVPKEVDPEVIHSAVNEAVVKAVSELPVPKDGKDGEPFSVELVEGMVLKAVSEIPAPRDGKDVDITVVETLVRKVVAELPVPKDGKDADPVDPAVLEQLVQKAISALPIPKDGKDADIAEVVVEANKHVDLLFEKLAAKNTEIITASVESIVATLPVPKDGKDADPGLIVEAVEAAVNVAVTKAISEIPKPQDLEIIKVVDLVLAAMPAPKNGRDGRDVDPAEVTNAVAEAVAALPPPKDGKDADPAVVERVVAEAVAKATSNIPSMVLATVGDRMLQETPRLKSEISNIIHQTMADPDLANAISELVDQSVGKAVAQIQVPRDGKDIDPEAVRGLVKSAVAEIPIPSDGKDADPQVVAQLILPQVRASVDSFLQTVQKEGPPGKSVTVGDFHQMFEAEYSKWALEFERRATDMMQRFVERIPPPKDGKDGFGFDTLDFEVDDEWNGHLRFVRGEETKEFKFRIPGLFDRGVYREGENYLKGDGVTWNGSFFIAQHDSPQGKPADDSKDWRMAVKRGRDGRDSGNGTPPPRGPIKLK